MRILVWKCRRWMGRKAYSEAWWQEHSDMHHVDDLAGGCRYGEALATHPVLAAPASFLSPRSVAPLGLDPALPAASRG